MKNRGGFTIVETLITLAVSSALFVTIMAVFSGRQGRVEFAQGMRELESEILDAANDVRNGYYPNPNQKCTVVSGNISFNSSPSSQGTNSDCVFAGKIIIFSSSSAADTQIAKKGKLTSYSLAGVKGALNLAALKAQLMGSSGTETAEEYQMPTGVNLITDTKTVVPQAQAAVALVFDLSGAALSSGANFGVLPYAVANTSLASASSLNAALNGLTSSNLIDSTGKKLCFSSGSSNQNAVLTISKGNNGLTTNLLIDQTLSGCWAGV